MKIKSINTKLTPSANHLVFNIDKVPDPEIKIETLGWGDLQVFIKDGLLYVVKPSTMQIDNAALTAITAKITAAEAKFARDKRDADQTRKRLLRDISLTLGIDLDTDREEDYDR